MIKMNLIDIFIAMKIIRINESQHNRLFEAYQQGFSFDELTMIADSAFADEDNSIPQMSYCRKWLGMPVSMGSSRCVFTLSDNIVLKLAYGNKYKAGIQQNREEYEIFERTKSPILARVYDCDKNFTYLVCESVVPAEGADFEKILGIPFFERYVQNSKKLTDWGTKYSGDRQVGYNKYFGDAIKDNGEYAPYCIFHILEYIEDRYVLGENQTAYKIGYNNIVYSDKIEEIINGNQWLSQLRELVSEVKIGDFTRVENFGIVNRDGNPSIVLLDSGLSIPVWQNHYA